MISPVIGLRGSSSANARPASNCFEELVHRNTLELVGGALTQSSAQVGDVINGPLDQIVELLCRGRRLVLPGILEQLRDLRRVRFHLLVLFRSRRQACLPEGIAIDGMGHTDE
eukprot:7019368-Pyramimonas_sp.AAC.1